MARKSRSKLAEWQDKARRGGNCEMCGSLSLILTVDHIIPVSILDTLDETGQAKYDDEENFQLICHPCNTLKSSRLIKRNPKTKSLLLKYL